MKVKKGSEKNGGIKIRPKSAEEFKPVKLRRRGASGPPALLMETCIILWRNEVDSPQPIGFQLPLSKPSSCLS